MEGSAALGMAVALLGLAVVMEHVSLARVIRISALAWRYLLMTTLPLGIGFGLEEWSVFAECKHLFFSLLASDVIWDLGRSLFSK